MHQQKTNQNVKENLLLTHYYVSVIHMTPLCSPALLYFILAIVSIIVLVVCHIPLLVIMIKLVFIVAWTWMLNFFCKKGYSNVSWIFVIAPFIVTVILIATGSVEGLQRKTAL